jgi:2-polyprenyl-3-methyl-5-hydroxy-6-metoxy-1,4-benzoquinol methylase
MQQEQLSITVRDASECVACGSPGTVEHEKLVDCLYDAPGTWALRRCSNKDCRFGWVDPQPSTSDLWQFYRNYWTHGSEETGPPLPDAQLSSGRKRIVKRIAGLIFPWRREALRSDGRYLARRSTGRLLDVGCGTGDFLAGMAQLGWEATGVEFDEAAVATARRHPGVRVLAGSLAEQQFPDNAFDAITLSNVIEHLPDPLGTFAELKRVLAPGGRLVIVTPNVNALGHCAFGRCWRGLEPPRHLYLYNRAVLSALAIRQQLKVEACFTVAATSSGILEGSLELWRRGPRSGNEPDLRLLKLREQVSTMFNADRGEFVVLLAGK